MCVITEEKIIEKEMNEHIQKTRIENWKNYKKFKEEQQKKKSLRKNNEYFDEN